MHQHEMKLSRANVQEDEIDHKRVAAGTLHRGFFVAFSYAASAGKIVTINVYA